MKRMHAFARMMLLALIPFTFLLWGFFTLGDYGVNGDEHRDFQRGHAFLHYFLTGSTTYDNVPGYADLVAAGAPQPDEAAALRMSAFQFQQPDRTAAWFTENNEIGHPPLNGILAAAFNKIFYQELGWVGDVESYHLYEILLATLGLTLVMWWAYLEFGWRAAFFAGLALALHPMYLGESRFNIKDPAETVFFTATLFAVWQALRTREDGESWHRFAWLTLAGVAGGVALATKFNILFILVIIGLWLLALLFTSLLQGLRKDRHDRATRDELPTPKFVLHQWFSWPTVAGSLIAAGIAVGILYVSWPYLWSAPLDRLRELVDYYRSVGTTSGPLTTYLTAGTTKFLTASGWNLYPLLDVLFRAPLVTLILGTIGIAGLIRYRGTPRFFTLLLWLIWLVIPILRVSVPGSVVYGATRQIMEYIPALALLAGVGALMTVESIRTWLTRFKRPKTSASTRSGIVTAVIVLLYLPVTLTMIRYNPNPQLFYNSLIGGLRGAHAIDFPFWYNTMGNAYAVGIDWLNIHADANAKLTTVFDSHLSFPPERFRADIQVDDPIRFGKSYFSQKAQGGEYIISLIPYGASVWTTDHSSSMTRYLERFLVPVYTYDVDGVPLLRIWKNDPAHRSYDPVVSSLPISPSEVSATDRQLLVDFGQIYRFDRLTIMPRNDTQCQPVTGGYIAISLDGDNWERIDNLAPSDEALNYSFSGDVLRYVSVQQDANSCLLTPHTIQAWTYEP